MSEEKDLEKFYKRVGQAIRARRLELGWTLEQTEEKGLNDWKQLQKIESGKNITLATLMKIAKVLKTTPAKLLE